MTPEPQKSAPKISARMIIGAIWLIGSEAVAIWFASAGLIFSFGVRRERHAIGRYKGIKVYVSERIGTPCLHGIIPSIYLTPAANESQERELILQHEFTHLRHGDNLWAVIRILALILLWWNPLVWAAALFSKQDSELSCDYAVTCKLDEKRRKDYAYMIIDMIPKRRTFATGFANNSIKERIIMMTKTHKNRIFATILAVLLVFCAVGCSFIGEKDKTDAGQTADIGEIIPKADSEYANGLKLFIYEGGEVYTGELIEEEKIAEILTDLREVKSETAEDFNHEKVEGKIYGFRFATKDLSYRNFAFVNGYLISESGDTFKFDYDFEALETEYFADAAENTTLTKDFPCLRYIAEDGDGWDAEYMPKKTLHEKNMTNSFAYLAKLRRFYGDSLEIVFENNGSKYPYLSFSYYNMHVLLGTEWYDIPTAKLYENENEGIANFLEPYENGLVKLDVPLDLPTGYYRVVVDGQSVEFAVEREERNRIVTEKDIGGIEVIDSVIRDAIPEICKREVNKDNFQATEYKILGMSKTGNELTAYIIAQYEEFKYENGELISENGRNVPAKLTLIENNGTYSLENFISTEKLRKEMESVFPEGLWQLNSSFTDIQQSIYKQAIEHFDVDIESILDGYAEILRAPAEMFYLVGNYYVEYSDDEYSNITELGRNHRSAINAIECYGEYALRYLCNWFANEYDESYADLMLVALLELVDYPGTRDLETKEYVDLVYTKAETLYENGSIDYNSNSMMAALVRARKNITADDPGEFAAQYKNDTLNYLFSHHIPNTDTYFHLYSSKSDPNDFKIAYTDELILNFKEQSISIPETYEYDSAIPICAGDRGKRESFFIVKLTNGDDITYLRYVNYSHAAHGSPDLFSFWNEATEADVIRAMNALKN